APVEEAHAQRGLEGLDAGAHRGLGDPQRLRGPPEPPEGPDGEERLDLGDLHVIRFSDRGDKRNQVARGREPWPDSKKGRGSARARGETLRRARRGPARTPRGRAGEEAPIVDPSRCG